MAGINEERYYAVNTMDNQVVANYSSLYVAIYI